MPGSSRRESLICGCISIASRRSSGAGFSSSCAASTLGRLAVEPGLEVLAPKHHRHAVMKRRDRGVGIAGDDGDRVHLVSFPVAPALPDPGEGDEPALAADEAGKAAACPLARPFIEAVGRHEAAPLGEGAAERALGGDAFAARIDHWRPRLWIPDEGRQQAPAHHAETARAVGIHAHHADFLRRRDIVAGREIWRIAVGEGGAYRFRRRSEAIA